jgi:biopolymer transport protein ExbB
MFLHADVIVKAVMIGLAIASFVTWTIWFVKGFELQRARGAIRRGLPPAGHLGPFLHRAVLS